MSVLFTPALIAFIILMACRFVRARLAIDRHTAGPALEYLFYEAVKAFLMSHTHRGPQFHHSGREDDELPELRQPRIAQDSASAVSLSDGKWRESRRISPIANRCPIAKKASCTSASATAP